MKQTTLIPLALLAGLALGGSSLAFFAKDDPPKLAHMVFFTLKDNSQESLDKFTAACQEYLPHHEGALYYSLGARAADIEEAPSVKDFDVALHLVFDGKASLDKYIKSDRHQAFLGIARPMLERARVFDSYLLER